MLQVARVAPKVLGESAALVRDFLLGQQNEDGGFRDRAGRSDLYYTVFALDGLLALRSELPTEKVTRFLESFRHGDGLDFVHLCCLARAWAALGVKLPAETREGILQSVKTFRSADGGFHIAAGSPVGSAYGCFLGLGVHQDLGGELENPLGLVQCLKFLETKDGAWTNERQIPVGSTNATAAAVTVLRHLAMPIHTGVADWLWQQQHPQGGFVAAPRAPIPDLLSTATALQALAGMGRDLDLLRESCLDFVDSLWTNAGAFHGHWHEEEVDAEYTYYGLLALGHLAS